MHLYRAHTADFPAASPVLITMLMRRSIGPSHFFYPHRQLPAGQHCHCHNEGCVESFNFRDRRVEAKPIEMCSRFQRSVGVAALLVTHIALGTIASRAGLGRMVHSAFQELAPLSPSLEDTEGMMRERAYASSMMQSTAAGEPDTSRDSKVVAPWPCIARCPRSIATQGLCGL